jgi:predicted MPP superfamily phosphohydrolase
MGLPSPKGEIKILTDPIITPLPSRPEPTVLGGSFPILVNASSEATGWSAQLLGKYDTGALSLVNSAYNGDNWILYFQTPSDLVPELYSLNLVFIDDSPVNITQDDSVWVMEDWPKSLTFSQISDIHLPYGADEFARYGYEMNLLDPDFVMVTGDVVDTETIASGWNYLHFVMNNMEIPLYLLPGNHDYAGADSRLFQKYGGLLNYSLVIGDFLFIAMDSHTGGYIYEEQLEWAESVLKKYPEKVKIIGFHHSILSREYQEDLGTVKGGRINGSWENMEDFENYMYFTWMDHMGNAQMLFRIIQENDVRLILAGHVHRDIVYILNDQHYFITTDPIGGGLPPGFYHGYRLITISNTGNIILDDYTENNLFDPPNAIPVNQIKYYYKTPNNGAGKAVSAQVINELDIDLENVRLEFTVSDDVELGEYTWHNQPEYFNSYSNHGAHKFVGYFDIPSREVVNITLASIQDNNEPIIEMVVPEAYEPGTTITVEINVRDDGWGVREVQSFYSSDDGETWLSLDIPFELEVTRDKMKVVYPSNHYNISLPEGLEFDELVLRADAWDFSDNYATMQKTITAITPISSYNLTINSNPTGILITLNDDEYRTPHSEILEEGNYEVEAPERVEIDEETYVFMEWSDGEKDRIRTINLEEDMEMNVYYEKVEAPGPQGIPLPTNFILLGLLLTVILLFLLRK